MAIVESIYVPVRYRATELGCAMPEGIAILPDNFCDANSRLGLIVRAESITLRNLFENASVPLDGFFPVGEHLATGHGDGLAWEACLFVPASAVRRDPDAVANAISLISAYLTDFFKGHHDRRIKLSVVVEEKHQEDCRKLTYEGDVPGLSAMTARILEVANR